MKKQDGISLTTIIIIVAIVIIGVVLIKNITNNSSIENTILTKDNFETTIKEYSKLKKETDDIVYLGYAVMYYTTADMLSNVFNVNATEDTAYARVYGKTIKDLKNEGKALMKENNITPKEFKENINKQSKY